MLFMIIERFTRGSQPVRDRFVRQGRLMPDGVRYVASWIDPKAERCFQIIDADDEHLVNLWTSRWADLVGFEIVPVVTSQEYWAGQSP